jgi:hypothetical protein
MIKSDMSASLVVELELLNAWLLLPVNTERTGPFAIAPQQSTVNESLGMISSFLGFVSLFKAVSPSLMGLRDYINSNCLAAFVVFLKVRYLHLMCSKP